MRTVDDKVVVALHQIRDAIKNKDCCNGGGSSDSSSKEVTIDDVVKFIHDNPPSISEFPYTKYDDIPNIPNEDEIEYNKDYIVKSTLEELDVLLSNEPNTTIETILEAGTYIIVKIRISKIG